MREITAYEVVADQVAAFNAHDVDAFTATYAPDAIVIGSAPEPLRGRDEMRAFYAGRLTDESLECEIVAATAFGERWIVCQERISDSRGHTEVIATFEVVAGLIVRASLVRGLTTARG